MPNLSERRSAAPVADLPKVTAMRDPLTGLLGRQGLRATLDRALERASSSAADGLIFKLSIDQAEQVAEAGGDAAFDAVMTELAQRLRMLLRAHDVMARPERTRIAVLFADCPESRAAALGSKILAAVSDRPFTAPLGQVTLTVSIGANELPDNGGSVDELFARTNSALRHAQSLGGNRLCLFRDVPLGRVASRRDFIMADRLAKALQAGQLQLAYQPVVDTRSGAVVFHEGLARLKTGPGRLSAARNFVPIAERLGLSFRLDCRALNIVMGALTTRPSSSLSVNISAATVTDRRAVESIIGTIAERRYLAPQLIVEITETAAIKDLAGSMAFVEALKGLGVRVALDDFGSGHTSFLHLRTLRPSIVKIDGSYVRDLSSDPDSALFVGALAKLATGLGATTVAEGVETEAEADALRALGIDMLQGYAIASPGPLDVTDAT